MRLYGSFVSSAFQMKHPDECRKKTSKFPQVIHVIFPCYLKKRRTWQPLSQLSLPTNALNILNILFILLIEKLIEKGLNATCFRAKLNKILYQERQIGSMTCPMNCPDTDSIDNFWLK